MSNKLYVGNISYKLTEEQLTELFSGYGTVQSSRVITDRHTGRSRGFAFVEMSSPEEAQSAIDALDGQENEGRNLRVNIAQERERRPSPSFNK